MIELRAQGGLVGIPHPFDSLRSALDKRLIPELAGEIRKMGIGDVSNILENENGYYIVRLLEKS